MEKNKLKISIPYLPHVSYNQIQAEELGLKHTEAILMNYFAYFLPLYGEVKTQKKKNYYWLSYSKIYKDMPTLDFSESTLRRHINKLMNKGVLDKIVVTIDSKSRAFYRPRKAFLCKTEKAPLQFDALYNNISTLLEEGKVYANEKDKLIKLLSSYKGSKQVNSTTYNLEGVKGTPIFDYLAEELTLSEKGEGVEINVGEEINLEYIKANIIEKAIENGINYGWIKRSESSGGYKFKGVAYDVSEEIRGKMLGNMKKMFQWLKDKKKPIKSWKGNINTWFGKSWI